LLLSADEAADSKSGSGDEAIMVDGTVRTPWFVYLQFAYASPAFADTDKNGKPDGAEDNDGDGLSDAQEQKVGTLPTDRDTDHNSLSDKAEVDSGPLSTSVPRPLNRC
jgi:hypothetical protein